MFRVFFTRIVNAKGILYAVISPKYILLMINVIINEIYS